MKRILLFLTILLLSFQAFSQTIIYNEDFSGQFNKGAKYNTTTNTTELDLTGVNWTLDVSATSLDQNSDWFKVLGANRFLEAKDLDGPGIWYSPSININAFTDVVFSLDARESSPTGNNLENADTIVTEFRVDGGAWTQAANNGFIQNDFLNTVVSDNTLINGNTLELRVTITNNGDGERMRIDNILVEGIAPTNPTITINPNTNTVAHLNTVENNVSLASETFTVQGSSLTNDIIIATPSSFVISTSPNGPYYNNLTLPQTAGTVNPTTIYTKLAFGLAVNTYNQNIVVSSIGVTNAINVATSGTVTAHTPATNCNSLFISEYHEAAPGTADEQYIELYNPTNTAIDLSNYQIARFLNGRVNYRPSIRTIPAGQGSIAPYSTFLIARNNSTLCDNGTADYCTSHAVMNFDGNDVIALQDRNNINIDVVGILDVNNFFGRNIDLVRNEDVQAPTVNYDASQWTSTASNNTTKLGSHTNDCQCPTTTTWDGTTWSNGIPDISTQAILNASYSTDVNGVFTACSLVINHNTSGTEFRLTVSNNTFIEIENNIEVNGELFVETSGNLVQNNDSSLFTLNSPTAKSLVNKLTPPLNSAFTYTYWSSPVANLTVANGLAPANPYRRFWYNAANFEDVLIENGNTNTFTPGQDDIDDDGNDWAYINNANASTFIMEPGMGFASTHGIFSMGPQFTYIFEGPLNNGQYSREIFYNGANGDNDWNFIGNPYPSAIDALDFLSKNASTINGVIYLWSHNTPANANASGNQGQNFTNADYAIITLNSGNTAGSSGIVPTSYIPSGQGFFVHGINNGNVTFSNTMRVADATSNNQFFRTSTAPENRLWLNLTSSNSTFNQMLVAYVNGATNGYDQGGYEAPKTLGSGSTAMIYTKIENDPRDFSIQGKNPNSLNIDEVIPVSFKSNLSSQTLYTFSIDHFEGDFLNNNAIYLKDNYTSAFHNLKASDYTFTSEAGEYDNRFEIVFDSNTLSVDKNEMAFNAIKIIELGNNNVQFIVGNNSSIKTITIYDALGKVIYNLKGNSSTETYNLSRLSKAPYIAQIELDNGVIVSKKAIKQ